GGPLFPRVVPLNGSIRSLRPGVHGVRLFVHPSTLADEDRIASGRITSAIRVRTALPGRYRPRPAWSPCRSPTHADTSDATTRAPRRSLPYWTRATRPPCDSPATRTRRQRHRSPHMRIPSPPVHPRPPRHGSGAALSTRTANPAEYSLRSTRATNPSPPHAPPRCRSPTGHQPPAAARSRRPGRPFAAKQPAVSAQQGAPPRSRSATLPPSLRFPVAHHVRSATSRPCCTPPTRHRRGRPHSLRPLPANRSRGRAPAPPRTPPRPTAARDAGRPRRPTPP